MKPDQVRVKNLLTDTVTLLCRNGLSFRDELKVEGLIGITLDNNEVFLVPIKQCFGTGAVSPSTNSREASSPPAAKIAKLEDRCEHNVTPTSSHEEALEASTGNNQQDNISSHDSQMSIKSEPEDDDDDLIITDAVAAPRKNSKRSGASRRHDRRADVRVPPLHGAQDFPQHPGFAPSISSGFPPASPSSDGGRLEGTPIGTAWSAAAMTTQEFLQPGSSWAAPEVHGLAFGTEEENMAALLTGGLGGMRRPRTGPKKFTCLVAGCSRSFYYSHDLRRHERLNHQRKPKATRRPQLRHQSGRMIPTGLYGMPGSTSKSDSARDLSLHQSNGSSQDLDKLLDAYHDQYGRTNTDSSHKRPQENTYAGSGGSSYESRLENSLAGSGDSSHKGGLENSVVGSVQVKSDRNDEPESSLEHSVAGSAECSHTGGLENSVAGSVQVKCERKDEFGSS